MHFKFPHTPITAKIEYDKDDSSFIVYRIFKKDLKAYFYKTMDRLEKESSDKK